MKTVHEKELELELKWLQLIILKRFQQLENQTVTMVMPLPFELSKDSHYGQFVQKHQLSVGDRLLLIMVLASIWQPSFFQGFLDNKDNTNFRPHFGGGFDKNIGQFYPTLQTVLFLLAHNEFSLKAHYLKCFNDQHLLFLNDILLIEENRTPQSVLHKKLMINDQFLYYFLGDAQPRLDKGHNLTAYLSQTPLTFEQVILPQSVHNSLHDLQLLMEYKSTLLEKEGAAGKVKACNLLVFSGLSGTGKTLTATTLGKKYNKPVYILNAAQTVSKYIGETSQNLDKVLKRLSGKDCILFIDEAENLLNKRVEVKGTNDKHANQDVSTILQLLNDYQGIIIMATNVHDLQGYIDTAFLRRIWRIIHFDFPSYSERIQLWENALLSAYEYAPNLMEDLAQHYQLTGSNIQNVASDAMLVADSQNTSVITFEMIERLLKIEFKKRGMPLKRTTDANIQRNPQARYGQKNMGRGRNFK